MFGPTAWKCREQDSSMVQPPDPISPMAACQEPADPALLPGRNQSRFISSIKSSDGIPTEFKQITSSFFDKIGSS